MHARIAWAAVGLATLAAILDTIFTAAHRSLLSEATWAEHGWPLVPLSGIGCALMGALVISRYPRHRLGWLLLAASMLSVTLAAESYSNWVLDGNGPGSPYWAHVAAWAAPLLGWPAFTALIMAFLISPDGHLPSPRWRWAGWAAAAGLTLHTIGTFTVHPSQAVQGEDFGNRSVSLPLFTAGYLLVAAALVASAASLAVRLRKARDDERRQLLWIASSATFLAIGVVVILAAPRLTGEEGTWFAALPLKLAQLAVPLCIAVAVLRHRLLAIDLIVNRALILSLATGLVAIAYVAIVVVIGLAVGGTTGFWPSILATAAVAIAFQPLRRGVTQIADRLAFGASAVPYEALADFSRRIGESPDPANLLPAVAEAAANSVNASRAVATLWVDSAPDQAATWPPDAANSSGASVTVVPVVDRGEQLGTITVTMPAGHDLRTRDQRLLADLADQAGMAFRTARLAAELSGQVDQLDHHTQQLADSRRRLISAGDAERSRLEQAIGRQVLRHLTPIPSRLRALSQPEGPGTHPLQPAQVAPLIDTVTTALEALRELTRGVFPAQLARSGLPAALRSLLARQQPATLVVDHSARGRRFDGRVEAAAYFCVAEATSMMQEPVTVAMEVRNHQLWTTITGRKGGDIPLEHMRDRIEAAGGSISVREIRDQISVGVGAPVAVPAAG